MIQVKPMEAGFGEARRWLAATAPARNEERVGIGMDKASVWPLVLAAFLFAGGTASGAPGEAMVRVGIAHVGPGGHSGELAGAPGARVGVGSAASLGLSAGYMVGEHLGLGLLGALPFRHDIRGRGEWAGAGRIASVRLLPPTLTLQYHLHPGGAIRPFVGAGFNYTRFFRERTHGLDGADLRLDSAWGWALEAGVDVEVSGDWGVSAQAWYMDLAATGRLGADLGDVRVAIDPWVLMLSVSRRF